MGALKQNRADGAEIFTARIRCGGCGDPRETVCRWCLRPYCAVHLPPHLHGCRITQLDPQVGSELWAWLKRHGYYKVRGKWGYRGTKKLWEVKR